ncbi:MAG: hypothetical protein WCX48_02595 [Bacteroidales bacterium]
MEERNLNNNESLELIAQMIMATKTKLERGGGGSIFLIWGYTTLLTAIVVYAGLALTGNPMYSWIWFAIPIVGSLLMLLFKRKRTKRVTTYIDRVISYVWTVIGCIACLIPIVSIFLDYRFPIITVIGILIMIGVTLTGLIIEFKALWICGILGIALSLCMPFFSGMNQIIIFAAIFVICMIIPGHILKCKEKRR